MVARLAPVCVRLALALLLFVAPQSATALPWQTPVEDERLHPTELFDGGLLHVLSPWGLQALAGHVFETLADDYSGGISLPIAPQPAGYPGGPLFLIDGGSVAADPLGLRFELGAAGGVVAALDLGDIESTLLLSLPNAQGEQPPCELRLTLPDTVFRFDALAPPGGDATAADLASSRPPTAVLAPCEFALNDAHIHSIALAVRHALLNTLAEEYWAHLRSATAAALQPRLAFAGLLALPSRGGAAAATLLMQSEPHAAPLWVECEGETPPADEDESDGARLLFLYDAGVRYEPPECSSGDVPEQHPLPSHTSPHAVVRALPPQTAPDEPWDEALVLSRAVIESALMGAVRTALFALPQSIPAAATTPDALCPLDDLWPTAAPLDLTRARDHDVRVQVRAVAHDGHPAGTLTLLPAGQAPAGPTTATLHLASGALLVEVLGTVADVELVLLRLSLANVTLALRPRTTETGGLGLALHDLDATDVAVTGGLLYAARADLSVARELLARVVATWVLLPESSFAIPSAVVSGAEWTAEDRYTVFLGR
jgi:hypothetical protein